MVTELEPHVFAFTRDQTIAVFNSLTLEKVYLSAEEFSSPGVLRTLPWAAEHPPVLPVVPDKPDTLQIAVTTRCNYRCIYCQLGKNPNPCTRQDMDLQDATRLVGEYPDIFRSGTVVVTAGEPLLNWAVTEYLLHHARSRAVLFTNASLVTTRVARALRGLNVFVLASLDGRAEEHDPARQAHDGRGTFDRTRRGITCLLESGCTVGISMVVHASNVQKLAEICDWIATEVGAVSVGINVPHYTERYQWTLPSAVVAEQFVRLLGVSRERGIFVDQIARILSPLMCERPRFRDCSACGTKVVVYPGGRTSNCVLNCLFTGGNDIRVWEHMSPLRNSHCANCFALGACGGSCPFDG